jgi:hypothetical protein
MRLARLSHTMRRPHVGEAKLSPAARQRRPPKSSHLGDLSLRGQPHRFHVARRILTRSKPLPRPACVRWYLTEPTRSTSSVFSIWRHPGSAESLHLAQQTSDRPHAPTPRRGRSASVITLNHHRSRFAEPPGGRLRLRERRLSDPAAGIGGGITTDFSAVRRQPGVNRPWVPLPAPMWSAIISARTASRTTKQLNPPQFSASPVERYRRLLFGDIAADSRDK